MTDRHLTHILVVDDDGASRYSISKALRRVGYAVSEAADAQQALERIGGHEFDLALTEIRLPGMNGIELLRRIKDHNSEAIVVLMTAQACLETAIEALRLGACDYLVKPCSSQDIFASVKRGTEQARDLRHRRRLLDAIKRDVFELTREVMDFARVSHQVGSEPQTSQDRERIAERTDTLRLGALTVFPGRHQIAVSEKSATLTPTELDLLLYLAAHRSRIVSCQELVREIRGYAVAEAEAREVIRPHVSNLRGKLRDIGEHSDLVVNVRGSGYQLSDAAPAG